MAAKKGTAKARVFPEISERVVAYWLLGSAASVFGIVVFGGLTRLTESGYHHPPPASRLNTKLLKSKHYRMEASNRQLTADERRGLGFGVQ